MAIHLKVTAVILIFDIGIGNNRSDIPFLLSERTDVGYYGLFHSHIAISNKITSLLNIINKNLQKSNHNHYKTIKLTCISINVHLLYFRSYLIYKTNGLVYIFYNNLKMNEQINE